MLERDDPRRLLAPVLRRIVGRSLARALAEDRAVLESGAYGGATSYQSHPS